MFFGMSTAERTGSSGGATSSRSQILGRRYQPFANPFFDHASTYTPPTVQSLFAFCRFYYLTHGVINAIVTKASEYPITDLIIQHEAQGVVRKWEELLLGVMNYRVHQFEFNLDYHCYGNCFISASFPFRKKIICANCSTEHDAVQTRPHWRYTNNRWWLSCPKCGQSDFAKSRDDYYPKYSEIGLIRWNPENVHIYYNETTGRLDYGLNLSASFRRDVMMGRKDLVATSPEIFLEAVKTKRSLVFDRTEVFHMRRPSLSSMERGWGIPLMMPVLKDAFYMQIMKKAQESVLLTHLVPQVFLFPQPATGGADPFCVSPSTLVETLQGLRPAEEIKEGDQLRNHEGRWRKVEAVIRRGVPKDEKVYAFKVSSLPGFPFTVSEEHPIFAAKSGQRQRGRVFDSTAVADPSFLEAKTLEVGDFVTYPVHRAVRNDLRVDLAEVCPDFTATEDWVYVRLDQQGAEIFEYLEENGVPKFRTGPGSERQAFLDAKGWDKQRYCSIVAMQDSEPTRSPRVIEIDKNWARIIGYYVAEGSTSYSTTTFAFHSDETSFVAELREALQAVGFSSEIDHRPDQNCSTVRVEGVLFAAFLRNLCGQYSDQKRLPAVISEAPNEVCLEALRCAFNGDGTFITADKKGTSRVCLKTTSPNLALEVRRLLLSFGFIAGVSRTVPAEMERAKKPYFQVYCNGKAGDDLAKLFGWSGYRDEGTRPERNAFIRDGYVYMRIAEITEVSEPEVIGFQMEGKTFCVAGVATHNTTVDLSNWREHIRRELARQRMDPSYYGILPFPLGHQTIGENGRSLLLMPEIQQIAEQISVGLGFPSDLVFGHGNYAGTSVSMRMLENFFLSNVHAQMRLLKWVLLRMSAFLNWPVPEARFKPFRMADDLQRQAFMFQMNSAGKVSDTTLLSYADLKTQDELAHMRVESSLRQDVLKQQQLLQAEIAGEAMVVQAKWNAKAQHAANEAAARQQPANDPFAQAQQSPLGAPGISLDAAASALAHRLRMMPPEQQQAYMAQLQSQSPEMAQHVQEQMVPPQAQQAQAQEGGQPQEAGVDMRPQPEVLPPRRG